MMESLRCIARQKKGAARYKWYMLCRIPGGWRMPDGPRPNGEPHDVDATR